MPKKHLMLGLKFGLDLDLGSVSDQQLKAGALFSFETLGLVPSLDCNAMAFRNVHI